MRLDGKTLGLLFELRDRLEERVAGIPAQQKALPRYMPDGTEVKTVEHVAAVLGVDPFVAHIYVDHVKSRQRKSLIDHAQRELSLIGMTVDDLDPMNAQMTDYILKMVQDFADQGHSGFSAAYAIGILEKLLRFENLSPITSNPNEWTHISEEIGGENLWQSKRNPALFSHDGGKTYHHVDKPEEVMEAVDATSPEYHESQAGLKAAVASMVTEVKAVRRVRTAAGARMYGQPIGSIIRPDAREFPGYVRVSNTPVHLSRAHVPKDEGTQPDATAPRKGDTITARDLPGTRRKRKTDVRPADPKDVPTGKAPAAEDPLLRAANDAIYEATRLGVDQSILDQLSHLRDRIRTGSSFVGGLTTDTTIRQARAQVRENSTADVALREFNNLAQAVATPRVWSNVPVKPVSAPAPVAPIKRTSKGKRILTPKQKQQKAALDKEWRKTHREIITAAKAYALSEYKDERLSAKLQRLQGDIETMRAQYKKSAWTPPVILRKKTGLGKARKGLLVMTTSQQADYDALPNEEARRMYRHMRVNEGSGHDNAIMKATEFAPKFAQNMKFGRKGKNFIRVQTTPEGDDYTLRQNSAGQWYATYDEGGETIEIDPARYRSAEYALAALERWHENYYAKLNAGKTRPTLPSGSKLTLGRRNTEGGIDYYKVTTSRNREYYLAYDGQGWYSVKYEKDGSETHVHDNYFADAEGALRFLEQADIESRRRKPGGSKPKPGQRVISQASLSKYDKVSYEDVKKGDSIATTEDGKVIEKQVELFAGPILFRTVKSKRGDYIYFTDGTKAELPWTVYRVKVTKDALMAALETATILLDELKDVSTGSGGTHTSSGFGGSADLSGRKRPVRAYRRRKPKALDRVRILLRKKALDDLAAFVALYEEKGVRRVRTREGMERFGLPMGAIIKPNHPGLVDAMGLDAMPKQGSKLPKPKKVDGWTVYEVDVLGQKFGISNDGSGWYSYFLDTEKYAEPNYHENPDDALDRLLDWVATRPKKKTPVAKVRIGSKEYPAGTKLKAGAIPPKANRDPKKRVMKPLDNKDTAAREALRLRLKEEWGVALPPGWTNLMVNADPDDDSLLVTGTSPTASDPNKRQPLYTPHHTERQKIANHQKAKKGLASRPKLEAAIKKDSATDDRAGMLALVLYMGLRPDTGGGPGLTGQTYGASTLERRHVVMRGRKMFLEFPPAKGKGKTISLEVTNPVVRKALDARMGLAPGDQLFGVSDKEANAYLKDKMGAQYTMKNLRTMVGTEAALAYIANRQPPFDMPTSRAAFKKIQKEVGEKVAEVLGNTPTVALNSYVDPGIWDEMEANIQ